MKARLIGLVLVVLTGCSAIPSLPAITPIDATAQVGQENHRSDSKVVSQSNMTIARDNVVNNSAMAMVYAFLAGHFSCMFSMLIFNYFKRKFNAKQTE